PGLQPSTRRLRRRAMWRRGDPDGPGSPPLLGEDNRRITSTAKLRPDAIPLARVAGGTATIARSVGRAMGLLATRALAVLSFPWPWNAAAIVGAAAWEVAGAVVSIRYSRRGRAQVGVETLVGSTATAITPLLPDGQVSVNGEIWRAHSDHDVSVGETVL